MIADYKLFEPYMSLKPGMLTILEQLPGYTTSADLTQSLDQSGYWPSYNRPYFQLFEISGMRAMAAEFGAYYSYMAWGMACRLYAA